MDNLRAYCGLDCSSCEAYIATRDDNNELRAETAVAWSKMYNADILPEHINCDGCKTDTGQLFAHCLKCGVRACASSKKFANCGVCDDFPCEKVKFIVDQVQDAREYLESQK